MPFSDDMSWKDWAFLISNATGNTVRTSENGIDAAAKWKDFAYGKTTTQLASALSVSEDAITRMNGCADTLFTLSTISEGQMTYLKRFI